MEYSLDQVRNTYHAWGQHPLLYRIACFITFLGRQKKLRKLAAKSLKLQPGDTVLDLACGTGLDFQYLEDTIGPQGAIIAFDYSQEMLEAAQRSAVAKGWKNIRFVQGDAAQLALDTQVDGVLSVLGISAIPQHKDALKRAVASLKDNGRISIMDARLPTGFWAIFNPLIAYIYKHWASWDYTKDIPEDLKPLVSDVKIETYNGGTFYLVQGEKSVQ